MPDYLSVPPDTSFDHNSRHFESILLNKRQKYFVCLFCFVLYGVLIQLFIPLFKEVSEEFYLIFIKRLTLLAGSRMLI